MARLLISTLMLIVFGSMVSAQGSYQIQPGDVLTIEVLEDASLNRDVLVLPDGTVNLPLIGGVVAAGRTVSTIQASIVSGLTPNFASAPNVFVSVSALNSAPVGGSDTHVFVLGAVNVPGKVHISSGTNILELLAEVQGFTPFAAKKRVQLRRTDSNTGKTMVFEFNYQAIERGTVGGNVFKLHNKDVIIVPERRLFE